MSEKTDRCPECGLPYAENAEVGEEYCMCAYGDDDLDEEEDR